ncbi:MAG: S-adenosylmethionine synthetase N-terminal domain-containing protein, partial [Syntrophales bacterium]
MLVSAESIKVGHPDLVADQISANIIADILDKERKMGLHVHNMPHCGIEVFLGKAFCLVGGEVTTRAHIDVERIVRETVLSLGYNDAAVGLNGNNMGI